MFTNPSAESIAGLLREAHTIAVVGLSPDPTRPSHGVARALQRFGYRVIPVNPSVESVLGEPAVASLTQLPEVLGADERVDIVDVFRRPVHIAGIVDECIHLPLSITSQAEHFVTSAAQGLSPAASAGWRVGRFALFSGLNARRVHEDARGRQRLRGVRRSCR